MDTHLYAGADPAEISRSSRRGSDWWTLLGTHTHNTKLNAAVVDAALIGGHTTWWFSLVSSHMAAVVDAALIGGHD